MMESDCDKMEIRREAGSDGSAQRVELSCWKLVQQKFQGDNPSKKK